MSLTNTMQYYGIITEHINRTYKQNVSCGQIFIWSAENHDCWLPWSGTLETLFRALSYKTTGPGSVWVFIYFLILLYFALKIYFKL
jgi:hypothetical protein